MFSYTYSRLPVSGHTVYSRRLHLCITGIGNPEPRYQNTRHNAGLFILDLLKEHYLPQASWKQCQTPNVKAKYIYDKNSDFLLLRSDGNFINLSGENVIPIWAKMKPIDKCVVVYDDLSVDIGKTQLRSPSSSIRGHNGLRNIVTLNNSGMSFYRLAVGIGRPESRDPQAVADYVLQRFTKSEMDLLIKQSLPSAISKLDKMQLH